MTEKENSAKEQDNPLPVLYDRLVPLSVRIHKDMKMVDNQNFSFAANANVIPIVAQELPMAVKHFPIVFAGGAGNVMLAILGINKNENLFVDDAGNWLQNIYIPAYIRRYPFFVARKTQDSEPIFFIDDSSTFVSPDGDKALFKNDEPSDELNRIVDFSRNFQQQFEATEKFATAVEEMGMLEEKQISFKNDNMVKENFGSFKVINRQKLDELDAETLKKWFSNGWIDSTVLHLASGSNFEQLWTMHRARNLI